LKKSYAASLLGSRTTNLFYFSSSDLVSEELRR